jgi:glutathione reductase (NADPH)
MRKLDVLVIGAGTAGQTAAYDLVEEGLSVGVVDMSERPGGVCALAGCQAKKWFYEATETVARAAHLMGKGITRMPKVDWASLLKEKNAFTGKIPESTVKGFAAAGIDYRKGRAAFTDADTVTVDGAVVDAQRIVIATGAGPMPLPFSGAGHLITSDQFLDLQSLPKRIAFIGGGFISFEFAHFAARLGASPGDIHILEVADRPLGPFDAEMVSQLVKASEAEGVRIHNGVNISAVAASGDGFTVKLASGDAIDVDLVVHGAGRAPNLEGLALEKAGVSATPAGITVDESMKTTNPRVWAIGDCAATIQLARVADQEGHVAAAAITADLQGGAAPAMNYSAVPMLLFTYPQYGMVGSTEDALKKEGVKYWKSADKGLGWPTYRRIGMTHAAYKILVDGENRVLGAHILSDNAAGLINCFRNAMLSGKTVEELYHENIVSPYPTRESDIIYMLSALLD